MPNPISTLHFFQHRRLLFFTMHQKEQAIAEQLKAHFQLDCIIPPGIQTDCFGTFSGEIPRPGSQEEAALAKMDAAIQQFPDETIFLVSEGAFYPHPDSPFVTVNTELLFLRDLQLNLTIKAWHTSLETRARTAFILPNTNWDSLLDSFEFPTYGIVLSRWEDNKQVAVVKDLLNVGSVSTQVQSWQQQFPQAKIQISHDLRAHRNPLRMAQIEQAGQKLIQQMKQACPTCGLPGLSPIDIQRGLPCAACYRPTRLVKSITYRCAASCGYETAQPPEDAPAAADPMHCDYCNP